MNTIYSHDEQKRINVGYSKMATVRCPSCGAVDRKYVDSHYTGGSPCVLLAKYCRYCHSSLKQ